jgi:hypothetical protein
LTFTSAEPDNELTPVPTNAANFNENKFEKDALIWGESSSAINAGGADAAIGTDAFDSGNKTEVSALEPAGAGTGNCSETSAPDGPAESEAETGLVLTVDASAGSVAGDLEEVVNADAPGFSRGSGLEALSNPETLPDAAKFATRADAEVVEGAVADCGRGSRSCAAVPNAKVPGTAASSPNTGTGRLAES